MTDTRIDVASQALARLGEPPISSFEDDSDAAERVGLLYEPQILHLLASHDWTFARRRAVLPEDAAAPVVNQWTRGFLLPPMRTDRVGQPLGVFASTSQGARRVFNYEISGRWIFTDNAAAVIEYTGRVPEFEWPGYFLHLAIEALAAAFALPITENASKEQLHRMNAFGTPSEGGRGGLFGMAVQADLMGAPTPSVLDDSDPITEIRFGGGRWHA